MTPKEKAVELVWKYKRYAHATIVDGSEPDSYILDKKIELLNAKQCAIIAVEEIMKMPNIEYSHNRDSSQYDYWQQVKEEIENL